MKKSYLYQGLADVVAGLCIVVVLPIMVVEILAEVLRSVFVFISSCCSKLLTVIGGNGLSRSLLEKRDRARELENRPKSV